MEISNEALTLIRQARRLTFLTGAGVSVPSGIPDYRSMDGIYYGIDEPEYLLSHSCLMAEPAKFYQFTQQLYHPKAQPNGIHLKMAALAQTKQQVKVVTQNIDQLHQLAGSPEVINFHGNLYDCYCLRCQQNVPVAEYLISDHHLNCGGQVRPNVILYEEGLEEEVVSASIQAVASADVIVIVGTSLRVQPFAQLIYHKDPQAKVIVVNREEISLALPYLFVSGDALPFFNKI